MQHFKVALVLTGTTSSCHFILLGYFLVGLILDFIMNEFPLITDLGLNDGAVGNEELTLLVSMI